MGSSLLKMILAGTLVLLTVPTYGEYYQYTDANGVLRFTDNIASVPPDQRPKVKTHQSVKSDPVHVAASHRLVDPDVALSSLTAEGTSLTDTGGTWNERISAQAEALDRRQLELNSMYQKLQAERTRLEGNAPPAWASANEHGDYRLRVDALNDRIDRYETQLAEYKQMEEAFQRKYKK